MAEAIRAALAAALFLALLAPAAAQPAPDDAPLTVAVAEAPPFAERGADGVWGGLGVVVAEAVGQRLGRPVRVVGVPADSALAVLGAGVDLALVPMTAEAEATVDFSAPFYAARLGVARGRADRITDVLGRLLSSTFLWLAGGILALLLVVGAAMWATERRHETDDFARGPRGLWDGFWWAGVTMTTIGYGDTVPRSVGGRVLALAWMLLSMAVTAALTAAVVSALGVRTGGPVAFAEELQGERVGVVAGSAAADVLREARVTAVPFPTAAAALEALSSDSLDAVAGAAPTLRAARAAGLGVAVSETSVDVERWAFAVAEGSPLREPVSRAVLAHVQSPGWPAEARRYVGTE